MVNAAKSVRLPNTRVSTSKTRTQFYVDCTDARPPSTEAVESDDLSIAVYLDTDNEAEIAGVLDRVDAIRQLMDFGPEYDVEIQRGSIFRRSRATARRLVASDEVQERLLKLERALELAAVDRRQAEFDSAEAVSVQRLIDSLQGTSRACVRIGSIFVVKYQAAGESVILVRNLSQAEIRALERFPEIQRSPEVAFSALATALATMEAVSAHDDAADRHIGAGGA